MPGTGMKQTKYAVESRTVPPHVFFTSSGAPRATSRRTSSDIPLAADVIAKGGHALNPRGELYSPENIQERLALRNFLDELRGTGERTGGPAALDNTDRKRFADQLDRFIAKLKRS